MKEGAAAGKDGKTYEVTATDHINKKMLDTFKKKLDESDSFAKTDPIEGDAWEDVPEDADDAALGIKITKGDKAYDAAEAEAEKTK
eukprot:TRINITY_DN1928_c0_g1_i1.p1 TRINITY_DN1928_c0_g1~~TRINITY_DN1928_c0_g1_i1.p1  ORF type:complete len:101 (+),score=16.59 TRINITY_DN1928_c0_g1_i1:47-304(+)